MATTTNQVITEQITRTRVEGAQKAASDAQKVDQAYDGVAESQEKIERTSKSAEQALLRFNRQFEPGYREAERLAKAQKDLTRAFEQGLVTQTDYARKLQLVTVANDNVVKTTGLARHQIQNLTAQFVDFGVQLSAGGGILLPLIQQGPQAIQAMGGLSNALDIVRTKWQALSLVTRGAVVGGGLAVATALAAKAAVDASRAIAEATQPERVENSLDRIGKAFANLANQIDLFFNRAPSNLFINSVDSAAQSMNELAEATRRARLERDALNAAVLQQAAPPTGPAGWATGPQGFFQPGAALGPAALGLPEIALPGRLPVELMGPAELGGGGERTVGAGDFREGRKELIDGFKSGFSDVMQNVPNQFGDAYARVYVPKQTEATNVTRQGLSQVDATGRQGVSATQTADTANQRGLTAIEQAIYAMGTAGPTGTDRSYSVDPGYFGLSASGLTAEEAEAYRRKLMSDPGFKYHSEGGGQQMQFQLLPGQVLSLGGTATGGAQRYSGTDYSIGAQVARAQELLARNRGLAGITDETQAAAGAAGTRDYQSALSPITSLMDRLRDQQQTVMSRTWRPDPYSDKNPDVFYAGGRLFKEQQDEIYKSLQSQIDSLAGLLTTAEQQLRATQQLPQGLAEALTSALSQAGMTGDQIAAALASMVTGAAIPPPPTVTTAQTGLLGNRMGSTQMRAFTLGYY